MGTLASLSNQGISLKHIMLVLLRFIGSVALLSGVALAVRPDDLTRGDDLACLDYVVTAMGCSDADELCDMLQSEEAYRRFTQIMADRPKRAAQRVKWYLEALAKHHEVSQSASHKGGRRNEHEKSATH